MVRCHRHGGGNDDRVQTDDRAVDASEYRVIRPVALRAGQRVNSPRIRMLEPGEKVLVLQELPGQIDGHHRCLVCPVDDRENGPPQRAAWTSLHTEGEPRVPTSYELRLLVAGVPVTMLCTAILAFCGCLMYCINVTSECDEQWYKEWMLPPSGAFGAYLGWIRLSRRHTKRTAIHSHAFLEATGARGSFPGGARASASRHTGCARRVWITCFGAHPQVSMCRSVKQLLKLGFVLIGLGVLGAVTFESAYAGGAFCRTPLSFEYCNDAGVALAWAMRKRGLRFGEMTTVERDCDRATAIASREHQLALPDGCGCEPGTGWDDNSKVCSVDAVTTRAKCKECALSARCDPFPPDRNPKIAWGDIPDFEVCNEFGMLSCAGSWSPWSECTTGSTSVAHACGVGGTRWRTFSVEAEAQGGRFHRYRQRSYMYTRSSDRGLSGNLVDYLAALRPDGLASCVAGGVDASYCPVGTVVALSAGVCNAAMQSQRWCCIGEIVATFSTEATFTPSYVSPSWCPFDDLVLSWQDLHNLDYYIRDVSGGSEYALSEFRDSVPYVSISSPDSYHYYYYDSRSLYSGASCTAADGELDVDETCNELSCPDCAAGTYTASDSPDATCAPCAPGEVAPYGTVSEPGRSGRTTLAPCEPCAMGRFANANQTACIACPAGRHTMKPASVGAGACVRCAQPTGYQSCLGGTCDGRHQGSPDPDVPTDPVGAEASLCSICIDGYYKDGANCYECGTGWFTIVVAILCLAGFVTGVTYIIMTFLNVADHLARGAGGFDLWMAFSMGAGQMQRLLQVITINYQFPQSWVDVADALRSFVDFDFPSLAQPECQIKVAPIDGLWLRVVITAVMLPSLWCLVGVGICAAQKHHKHERPFKVWEEIGIALHSIFFVTLLKAGFVPFDCTVDEETGRGTLDANNVVECDSVDGSDLSTIGGGILVVYGLIMPLFHLPNWVETISMVNKTIVISITTFLSNSERASAALFLLLCTSAAFAWLGYHLRRKCGMGFRVIQIGSAIEMFGYVVGQYFVWCAEDLSADDAVEYTAECSDGVLPNVLGIAIGVLNVGFVMWAVYIGVNEEASHTEDDPSCARDYIVTAPTVILAGRNADSEKLGDVVAGTRITVWEDTMLAGQIKVELLRDSQGMLDVGVIACKQLAARDMAGNDLVVEVLVNGQTKRTNIRRRAKADVDFSNDDGEIAYEVVASRPVETTQKLSISSKHTGAVQPREIVTAYEEQEIAGHRRVRIRPYAENKRSGSSRWVTRVAPTEEAPLLKPATTLSGARLKFPVEKVDTVRVQAFDIDFHRLQKDTKSLIGTAVLLDTTREGQLKVSERTVSKWETTKLGWFQLSAPEKVDQHGHKSQRFVRVTSTGWVTDPWHALSRQHEWLKVTNDANGAACIVPAPEDHTNGEVHRVESVRGQRGYTNKWAERNATATASGNTLRFETPLEE